jgi:hypothetical protein
MNNSAASWVIYGVVIAAVVVFMLAAMWKVFVKAGRPGWACIVPIYNAYVMLKIAGKPGWWLLLFLVPGVNIVIEILVQVGIAEKFGKDGGFVVGMIFLPIIFYPILGFGSATYKA